MSQMMKLATTVLLSISVAAHAQTNATYKLVSTNAVGPGVSSTTIEIWVTWTDPPGADLQFIQGDYDLAASDGRFVNPVNVAGGPGSSTGIIAGGTISGANNGGALLPSPPNFPPFQPMLLATYDWATTDFTPRTVDLQTSNTTTFMLGNWPTGNFIELIPNNFTPGSGTITVVPAPTTWLVFTLPLIASRRRQRH
jgi:hypothetical protein